MGGLKHMARGSELGQQGLQSGSLDSFGKYEGRLKLWTFN